MSFTLGVKRRQWEGEETKKEIFGTHVYKILFFR